MLIEQLFKGKIRVKLLTRLLLNPNVKVYLRGLEKDLGVSSNTVRLELNKLSEMHLIQVDQTNSSGSRKQYRINTSHPLFNSLRNIIMNYVGIEQIIEQIVQKLGSLDHVYITGELAAGKTSGFIDLVIVGDVDREYLYRLVEKAEKMIQQKIRVALFLPNEFSVDKLSGLTHFVDILEY